VKPDGEQRENKSSDTGALFRLGKEAYKRLGECQSQAEFDEGISGYYEMIDTFRERFTEWDNERKIKLVSERDGKDIAIEWDNEQVLNTAWQFFTRLENTTDAEIKRIYVELFLFHALKEIDHANVALDLGHSDAVYSAIEAANALANAMSIESGNEKLQKDRQDLFSRLGKSGADLRHAPMRELRDWALDQYQAGNWPSANKASHDLKEKVLAHGRTIGAHLTVENAQRTIAEWIRKSA